MKKRAITPFFLLFLLLDVIACSGGTSSTLSSSPSFLSWDPPTSSAQAEPIANLDGYKIYYGTTPGVYSGFIDVPGNVTQYPIADLSSTVPVKGTTYYIAVTAFDYDNYESEYSNEITKYIN